MYAVIKIGGNQYQVTTDQKIQVDKLTANTGETVKFPSLLVADSGKVVVGSEANKILVSAKVLKTYKGKKVDISRFHHKTRHRRHIGFRPMHTDLQIIAIGEAKKVPVKSKTAVKPKATSKSKKTA